MVVPPLEGEVDPGAGLGRARVLDSATPSSGATFDGGSVAIWDGSQWVQQYVEPGVGSWAVVNGEVLFVPLPGFSGTATSRVRVTDSAGRSTTAPVSFTVLEEPVLRADPQKGSGGSGAIPQAPAESGVVVPGQSGTVESGAFAVDPVPGVVPSSGATLDRSSVRIWDGTEWVSGYADPGVGTWSVVDGRVTFVPVPGFCGNASTTYRVTDSAGASGTAPVVAAVPCPGGQAPDRGAAGVVPAPAPPLLPASQQLDAGAIRGLATVEGGIASPGSWVTPSPGATLDMASLVLWDGTAWVKSFTDPGVGTWRVVGSRIMFTPAAGFTGVARTTYRIVDTAGHVGQGPITFTVARGCPNGVFTERVVTFSPLSDRVTADQRGRITAVTDRGCSYLVTGYVQPVGTTSNDTSLSRDRATAVAQIMTLHRPRADITTAAGERLIQDSCRSAENRCVIIRVMPN